MNFTIYFNLLPFFVKVKLLRSLVKRMLRELFLIVRLNLVRVLIGEILILNLDTFTTADAPIMVFVQVFLQIGSQESVCPHCLKGSIWLMIRGRLSQSNG